MRNPRQVTEGLQKSTDLVTKSTKRQQCRNGVRTETNFLSLPPAVTVPLSTVYSDL